MGAEIKDEYSVMPISRQRKYYLRQRKRRRCTKCGKPVDEGSLCLEHLIQMREYRREKFGLKRRYRNSLSYKAAAKAESHLTCTEAPAPLAELSPANSLGMSVPATHELREIKQHVDSVLTQLRPDLRKLPVNGCHFAPELLLKSWVLSNLYSIRSSRLFCEQLPFNLLWLWFLDLELGKVNLEPAAFGQAYERLLLTDVARDFFAAVFTASKMHAA
jgi:hypothetical protein